MPTKSPNRGVMIVLAYLWPLALVPLLIDKDDADVQWHAKHGLILMAVEIVALVAYGVVASLAGVAAFGLGCAISMLVVFLWMGILALHAAAIVLAINGKRLIVPGVSEYANRF